MKNSLLLTFLAAAIAAPVAQAQAPDCSSATVITTTGQWSWLANRGQAQTEYSPGSDCEFFPSHADYFFEWTAPTTGHFQIDTLGSTWDTQLAIYAGSGCTTSCVDYDFGTGAISSNFPIPTSIILLRDVTAGDVFLIRVGGLSESHTPTDRLNINEYTDPCIDGTDDALEDNETLAHAIPFDDGSYANLWVSHADPDHFSFCVAPGNTLQVDLLFTHANGNVQAKLLSTNTTYPDWEGTRLDHGFTNTDNESLTWTNTSATNEQVTLRVFINGETSPSDCNDYDLIVSGSGPCDFTANTFCDPMDPNSTGLSTNLSASPSTTAETRLRLEVNQGPPGQFGYFLVGTAPSAPGLALGQGHLCFDLGGFQRLGRYNVAGSPMNSLGRFQPDGTLNNIVGTSGNGKGFDVPASLPFNWFYGQNIRVVAGQTWHYQLWHREPNGNSNFSNGLSVLF
ncbi:MAG: hypothetical protein JKY61_05760 [Planctomycetes bacterium]|nr:hypothetical protein [Planctomycetota bacterium]